MTSDDTHDRFDPMTGQPIDRPTDATHRVAPTDIAAPGQVHADYDRQRTAPEPRDIILDLPQARAMTAAQRAAAKRRAREASIITIDLPDLGTVKAMPKSFDRVLMDASLTGLISTASQRSFYEASKALEGMGPDEQMRLGEDADEVFAKLGIGQSQDFYGALSQTYPIACLVDPRCVATEADITDPEHEICLNDLTHEDRAAIFNACGKERMERAVALAPFPDPSTPV